MSEDFHARFSARARSYRYVISNQVSRSALLVGKATWCVKPLDVERMQQAANSLLGKHDFTSFRALACQANTPIRTLHELRLRREGSLVILDVTANAFLHHMVRNLAGVLMAIGSGEREVSWAAELLQQRDRSQAGVTAKPDGLYFLAVQYDSQFEI
jgi:tRNA pseudouridine38-40 synthase